MNLLRAFFIVSELIIIAGIVCIINIDMELSSKFSWIFGAIVMMVLTYIICDIIGWHLWKKKCDKELVEDLRKIKEE